MQQPRRRLARVRRCRSWHRTSMRYRSSNTASQKGTYASVLRHTNSELLLASVLPAASATEQYSRTEDKIDGPPILLGREERGRRDAGGCCRHNFCVQIAACKNHNLGLCKTQILQGNAKRRRLPLAAGSHAGSHSIYHVLACPHTPNATSSRRGTRRRTSSTRSSVETTTTVMAVPCAPPGRMTVRCAPPAAPRL